MRSESVVQVVGGTLGPSAAREGVTEAARRLSHALAEIVGVLQVEHDDSGMTGDAVDRALQKAKGALAEWGVA